jgi:bacillithiol system protein YtxJ
MALGCNLQSSDRQLTITNSNMDWKVLRDEAELEEIIKRSVTRPQVIFKHSTRCSISSVAKGRLDRSDAPDDIDFYYLDLIGHRNISNKVSEIFNVHHESPQVLVIRNGECVYDESHMGINMKDILAIRN